MSCGVTRKNWDSAGRELVKACCFITVILINWHLYLEREKKDRVRDLDIDL